DFKSNKKFILLLSFFLCIQISFSQFTISEKPSFIPPVIDSIKLLSKTEYESLYNKLKQYNDTTSTEVLVAIVSSVQGGDINYVGAQWGHKWEIGQKGKDNGILVLLAKDDRKVAISTGYGTEHLLTDALSKRIIENIIIPEFKNGNYYNGLNRGTDVIFQVMQGEYEGSTVHSEKSPMSKFVILAIIFVVILIILTKGRNNGRGNRGRRSAGMDLMDILILSNMGRGGFKGSS